MFSMIAERIAERNALNRFNLRQNNKYEASMKHKFIFLIHVLSLKDKILTSMSTASIGRG